MAALIFPSSPVIGQLFPPDPGISGVTQYIYTGTVWNTVPVFVRLNNQQAYNEYVWPDDKSPISGYQITDSLADGVLSWEIPGGPFIYIDDISGSFDGVAQVFQLTQTGVNYIPDPLTNIIIVLGGIVQTPGTSYVIDAFGQITFSLAPAPGAAFVAISNLNCD